MAQLEFGPPIPLLDKVVSNAKAEHLVDIDGDGDLDVLITSTTNSLAWFENFDGKGSSKIAKIITGL